MGDHTPMKNRPAPWGRVLEGIALWGAVGFSAAALIGFATFGVHPRLLAHVPWSAPIFAVSFRLFSVGQILVAAGALVVLLMLRAPWRWVLALIALYVISLGSELSGTSVGFPFGPYHYTGLLGAKWFGLVPLVIPLSWFMMAVPSYFLARWAVPGGGATTHVILGTLILTLWDLALDPAMSYATPYWLWEVEGIYYGMPLVNLAGWLFTSALIMIALVLLGSGEWVDRLPFRWMTVFYAANVILPLGMTAAAGLWWGVVITLAGYGLLALAVVGGHSLGLWGAPASEAVAAQAGSAIPGDLGRWREARPAPADEAGGERGGGRLDAVHER
jgi:uncharacterized membrane protein